MPPSSPAPPFLDLRHVSVARDGRTVLHDLTLRIERGECVAIVGPNGCGKSTLIRMVSCELYPLRTPEMHLRIFGRERWDVSELRRHFGIVSADPPGPAMLGNTGLETVLTGFFSSTRLWPNLHVNNAMRERALQAIALTGAGSLAGVPLSAMSSGQQRRVLLARALAPQSADTAPQSEDSAPQSEDTVLRTLLLDEPSNTLDLAAQRDLRHTLSRLAQAGTGLLLITHRLEDIIPEIRRVLLLRDGRLLADGPKEDLLTSTHLSSLFGTAVQVSHRDSHFQAW